MSDPIREARALGQSVWQDDLSRAMIDGGELRALVEAGVSGITANPTTFEKAMGRSGAYDDRLRRLLQEGIRRPEALYERLAVEDVREAADLLLPAHDETDGRDGFVSFEVSPHLAHDTSRTMAEARHLHRLIGRRNAMIKVPGTPEGFPAIAALISEGIHVNVTLLFGLDAYRYAAEAYMTGLERLIEAGGDPSRVSSVASFFLSRIDTQVDAQLAAMDPDHPLLGRTAIANAKLAYAAFREMLEGPRWKALAAWGARPQRVLWASTGVKNPRYPPLHYVEALVGRDTVDTMPPETLREFRRKGTVRETLPEGLEQARRTFEALAAEGVDVAAVTERLVDQGVELFAASYDKLLRTLEARISD